jgi:hypothetical protein
MSECTECERYRACSNGSETRCPRHAWEAQNQVLSRDGNLDAYYREKEEIRVAREAALRKERGR